MDGSGVVAEVVADPFLKGFLSSVCAFFPNSFFVLSPDAYLVWFIKGIVVGRCPVVHSWKYFF